MTRSGYSAGVGQGQCESKAGRVIRRQEGRLIKIRSGSGQMDSEPANEQEKQGTKRDKSEFK